MERPPLSLSEVLDEELLFLHRRRRAQGFRPRRRANGESPWDFRESDFCEVACLLEKLQSDRPKYKYALLRKAAPKTAGIAERFNALSKRGDLLSALLHDPDFAAELLKRPDVVRRVLAHRPLRIRLLEGIDEPCFSTLLEPDMLRACVAGSDEVERLLAYSEIDRAVRKQRHLFGSIIESSALRDRLSEQAHRAKVVNLAAVESGWLGRVWNSIRGFFRRREVERPRAVDFRDPADIVNALDGKDESRADLG